MELHVRAVSARNLLDKQTFGKQDPYCKISVRNKTFKTRVHDNGDRTPVWNEKFVFEVYDTQLEQLHIQVKDKNFTASVLIGELRLPVNMFLHGNVTDQWYTLNNGSKRAGEINLRVQLLGGPGGAGKASSAKAYQPMTPAGVAYAYPPQQSSYPQQPPPQQPSYPQQPPPPHAYPQPPPPQSYPQPAPAAYPQHYAPTPQYQQQPPPPPWQSQPPPAAYMAPPPPVYHMPAPPPPVLVAPPPAVVYAAPAAVAYPAYPPHHYHHHHGHHRRGSFGGGAGEVALGVGAGVVGGMLLGEALDGLFD